MRLEQGLLALKDGVSLSSGASGKDEENGNQYE
jgi:hypothetical protein